MRRRHKSKFDYYHELGVEETAMIEQIKSAYRILAKRFHPDKNKHDEKSQEEAAAKFKRIAEAYEVLNDPEIRKQYDNYEHPAVRIPPKPGGVNTNGTDKSAESIPKRSPFVDFIRDVAVDDNTRRDEIRKPKKQKPFTNYQK